MPLTNLVIIANFFRFWPFIILIFLHKNRYPIRKDIQFWLLKLKKPYSLTVGLVYLLSFHLPFRNLFLYRLGNMNFVLNIFCKKLPSLLIETHFIGENIYIEHGHSTIIGAESIGNNCVIYNNVTIGSHNGRKPIINNNVVIRTGAVVVGNITIGNNVVIGANTFICKSLPDNVTVFLNQPNIIKWNNQTVNENELGNKIYS